MAIDINTTGIDLDDPALAPFLGDLQGNILRGHGRDHSVHIFLEFQDDSAAVRRWIRDFADASIVSAKQQRENTATLGPNSEAPFASFLLSANGYRALGISGTPSDRPFEEGMKERAGALKDPPVSSWEETFQKDIDALIILANKREDLVKAAARKVMDSLVGVADVAGTEFGQVIIDHGKHVEHFGFVDGISQPLFAKRDIDKAKARGFTNFDPSAPLSLVLVKDPNGVSDDSYGSFLTYRKLAEDKKGWDDEVVALAGKLGISPDLAGAYAMGRFQDGTPVMLGDKPQGNKDPGNDFGYDGDMEGSRCPFHAHVRKANPRGDTVRLFGKNLREEREHRIVRRGITYGEPGGDDVGLLFLNYQADIDMQFEFQQATWSNNINFAKTETGLDPVIGQGRQLEGGQAWPKRYGAAPAGFERSDFRLFVTMKGGEHFYAPSIGFLKQL